MAVGTANETETGRATRPVTVKVWDPFVRIFHWSLVALFALAWASEDLQALHQPVGYAVLGLVALRIGWGFVGPRHARFSDFVRSPTATLAYARALLTGTAPRLLGHTPIGGLMVLTLLACLLATGTSGWLMTTEAFRTAEWLEDLHEGLAALTLALVGVHVLGVLAMSALHGENLVTAMITGRKRR
ncbi:MAG TPA: cytochrome b/b6 domain-containing protein [Hyphomicrobiaceae bacterium]|nr:cytochrome b/b6 domain-containing protein [Hyphomicrobiaceae bacterium]